MTERLQNDLELSSKTLLLQVVLLPLASSAVLQLLLSLSIFTFYALKLNFFFPYFVIYPKFLYYSLAFDFYIFKTCGLLAVCNDIHTRLKMHIIVIFLSHSTNLIYYYFYYFN